MQVTCYLRYEPYDQLASQRATASGHSCEHPLGLPLGALGKDPRLRRHSGSQSLSSEMPRTCVKAKARNRNSGADGPATNH